MTLDIEAGMNVGRLTVIKLEKAHSPRLWRLRCGCGAEIVLPAFRFKRLPTCGKECMRARMGNRGPRQKGPNYGKAVELNKKGLTVTEIARELGISYCRVQQILKASGHQVIT